MPSIAKRLRWKKFLKGFLLWLLCIPINFVPVFMVYINSTQAKTFKTAKELMSAVVKDIDFLFIFIAVLFVLPLQGLFADYCDANFQESGKACSVACYFCSAILLALYFLCKSNSEANRLLYSKVSFGFNIAILVLTIVAGAAVHALMSIGEIKGKGQE